MRLQEKLKGVEEGTVLSVGGQVNLLIQQAMDPKNLSRLFPGWKAWVWYSAYELPLNSAFWKYILAFIFNPPVYFE